MTSLMPTLLLTLSLALSLMLPARADPLLNQSSQTEMVAKAYFEAYLARDWDRLEALLDPQGRFEDPTARAIFGTAAQQGKAGVMRFFRDNYATIEAMQFYPQSQFASGEHMVFVGELAWTLGLQDGLKVSTRMPFVVRLQVREDKVVEHIDIADYKPFVLALKQARKARQAGG